jgi:flagellar basal body-associated protein FliL
MSKKTNKRIKKGGASFLEIIPPIKDNVNKYGPFISDDVDYAVRNKKDKELLDKYDKEVEDAKVKVIMAKEEDKRSKEEEELLLKDEKRKQELKNFRQRQREHRWRVISGIIFRFFEFSGKIINFFTNNISSFIKNFLEFIRKFGNVADGAVIKILLFILIIVALFFGISAFFGSKSPNENINNNIAEMGNTNKNFNSFLIKTESKSFFKDVSNYFTNLVPQEYQISFNKFRNATNKLVGNDIMSINGVPREIITEGRNDGIYHVKKPDDPTYTYTRIKPKDIELNLSDIKNIPDADFNKLPLKIQNEFQIDNKYKLETKRDDNSGLWYYDAEDIKDSGGITIKSKGQKTPIINTIKTNEFKLNNLKPYIFTNKDEKPSDKIDKLFTYEASKYLYPITFINKEINKNPLIK